MLLDFLTLPELACSQRGIPHGDALSLSIAAASIVAKVTRDRWMCEQEDAYPGYGFSQHKGYATELHRDAIGRLGPCAHPPDELRAAVQWASAHAVRR